MQPLSFYLIHWLISAAALLITARIVPGFEIRGCLAPMVAAVVIGIANVIIWPVLFVLTLPITILTLGLFALVVNAAVLKICAAVLPGFAIKGWLAAIFGWIVLTLVTVGLRYFFSPTPLPIYA